jgi:hypothetical protein
MKLRPYVVILEDRDTGEISHDIVMSVLTRISSDVYKAVSFRYNVLHIRQTDDVEEAYTMCRSSLDVDAENAFQRGEKLKVLADKVDIALKKMLVVD